MIKKLQPKERERMCLKANAEMVPNTPSCYCMLLM